MINQNTTQIPELTPASSRLRGFLNCPSVVKTAIGISIVALSGGLGFVNCLNRNDAERDACLNNEVPLAIGFGAVGAVLTAVIFKCIRESSAVVPYQGREPSSSFGPLAVVPLGAASGRVASDQVRHS